MHMFFFKNSSVLSTLHPLSIWSVHLPAQKISVLSISANKISFLQHLGNSLQRGEEDIKICSLNRLSTNPHLCQPLHFCPLSFRQPSQGRIPQMRFALLSQVWERKLGSGLPLPPDQDLGTLTKVCSKGKKKWLHIHTFLKVAFPWFSICFIAVSLWLFPGASVQLIQPTSCCFCGATRTWSFLVHHFADVLQSQLFVHYNCFQISYQFFLISYIYLL